MKRRALSMPGIPVVPIAILVVAVLFALSVAIPSVREMLWTGETRSGSVSLWTGVRDLDDLETVVWVGRTVFPHDYLKDHLTITALQRKIAVSGTTAAEALEPAELLHLRAANLAATLGLLGSDGTAGSRFVVITTRMYLGYRMADIIELVEPLMEEHLERSPSGGSPEPLRVVLPDPRVLSVVTEDIQRATYPFPAIPLDADGWRQVTTFVQDSIEQTAPMGELRRTAAHQAAQFLSGFLDMEITAPP